MDTKKATAKLEAAKYNVEQYEKHHHQSYLDSAISLIEEATAALIKLPCLCGYDEETSQRADIVCPLHD